MENGGRNLRRKVIKAEQKLNEKIERTKKEENNPTNSKVVAKIQERNHLLKRHRTEGDLV